MTEEELREELFLKIKRCLDIGDIEETEKILEENKDIVDIKEVRDTWNEFHVILCHFPKKVPKKSIQYLIRKGVNPVLKDYAGMTPLNYAMRAKNLEAVKLLLKAGGNPNAVCFKGLDMPFYSATSFLPFQEDLVKLFLVCGANIYIRLNDNENLIEKINNFIDPERKEEREFFNKYHKELEEKGYKYFQEKWDYLLEDSEESPLHIAARKFQVAKVKELLKNGADIYAKDSLNYTPLMKALARCQLSDMKEMLEISELLPEEVTENQQSFIRRLGEWKEDYKSRFNNPNSEFEILDTLFIKLCERFKIQIEEKKKVKLPKLSEKELELEKEHQKLWEQLVPKEGKAETLQGEVIRITGKIAKEVLENGGKNWSFDYRDFLRVIFKYFEREKSLTNEQLAEVKKCTKKLNAHGVGNKHAYILKHLGVVWVLQNPKLIPLGRVHYNL